MFDALAQVQVALGYDLLGYACPRWLNGLLGPDSWKIGLTLATLSPAVWEYIPRQGAKWQFVLMWLGAAVVVLLASNQQSRVVFGLAAPA